MRSSLTLLVVLGTFLTAGSITLAEAKDDANTIVFAPGLDLVEAIDALPEDAVVTIVIPNGQDVQKRATEAFIECPPGGILQFEEGKYEFTSALQLRETEDVTIRGRGRDKTILNFSKQLSGTGGEGILAKADGVTFVDLTVEETKGDGIKVEGSNRVVFRNVATLWHSEGNPKNGAYGLYPVQCKNVLIEDCLAVGSSDAGIYVGQSENIIVRRCRAEKNVAGIEIENSKNADVYENEATNNAGGLLIFDLPSLPTGNGGGHRIYRNKVYANNHVNFAPPGNIVADIPQGMGMMVMATNDVEIFENTIQDNQSTNLSIISFLFTGRPIQDAKYDPFTERIYVHDNKFSGGGDKPAGNLTMLAELIGKPMPDILVDGIRNPKAASPAEQVIFIENNGDADYVNLRLDLLEDPTALADPAKRIAAFLAHANKIERDITTVGGKAQSRGPVALEGVSVD